MFVLVIVFFMGSEPMLPPVLPMFPDQERCLQVGKDVAPKLAEELKASNVKYQCIPLVVMDERRATND